MQTLHASSPDGYAAALAAQGESRVQPLETVERGYGRLVERLQGLGARVEKVSSD